MKKIILLIILFFGILNLSAQERIDTLKSKNQTEQYQNKVETKTTTSAQCKGIAKSTGVRCRNKTKNANGYCYIHKYQAPGYKAPPKVDYVGRCCAITKSGTRCKRNASSGSRYCWQHK